MRRWASALGAVAVTVAAAILVVAVVLGVGARGQQAGVELVLSERAIETGRWIEVRGMLTPRVAAFADTVTARVDVVTLDRRVDAQSVRLQPSFAPWEPATPPERTVREDGRITHLRVVYRLRCFVLSCAPVDGEPRRTRLEPVAVSYRRLGDARSEPRRTLRVRWPTLVVHTRLNLAELERGSTPWRADLVSLPELSYRVRPGVAGGALLGTSAIFALAGLGLLYGARPRRPELAEPEPEPEVELSPPPPPLEVALALLEHPTGTNGAADRRRALQLLASELRAHDGGGLAGEARSLAWSQDAPAVAPAQAFASRVRELLLAPPPEPEGDEEQADA